MTHTWETLAMAAGAETREQADLLLWAGSAFPFSSAKMTYYQIKHTARHKVCCDDPEAHCGWNRSVAKACRLMRRSLTSSTGIPALSSSLLVREEA